MTNNNWYKSNWTRDRETGELVVSAMSIVINHESYATTLVLTRNPGTATYFAQSHDFSQKIELSEHNWDEAQKQALGAFAKSASRELEHARNRNQAIQNIIQNKNTVIRAIIAARRDKFDADTLLTRLFEIPDEKFDLLAAVKNAAIDWCKTQEGAEQYEINNREFNWYDFDQHVPDEFCEKHGFKRIRSDKSYCIAPESIEVNGYEDLVDEFDLEDSET